MSRRTHRRPSTFPPLPSLWVLALMACGAETPARVAGNPQTASGGVAPERPPAITVGGLVREYRPTFDDPLALVTPGDVEVVDGLLYIVEPTVDRITVTDTLLNLVRRFGRTGEGPGELKTPWSLDLLPSGNLAIPEIGNGRISIFTPEGRFVRTIPRATPHTTPAGFDDTTFVVSGPGGDFGAAIAFGPSGTGEPFGPTGLPERGIMEISADPSTLVRTEDGDLMVVIRGTEGILEVYDRTGRMRRMDTIPADVWDRLAERQRRIERGFREQGLKMLPSSLVKSPSATSTGELLILLTLPDPFGLLYSPRDGRMTRLNATEHPRERDILRRANSGFLDGETLYVVQDGGIAVFHLPGG